MTNPNGRILYHGPSELDGADIVVIATGFTKASKNTKTGGDLLQVFIMCADIAPHAALKTGDDYSVCGDCRHRPTILEDGTVIPGSCYVTVHHGPRAAWQCWATGSGYGELSLAVDAAVLASTGIRFGAYGDPAAVPFSVWEPLLALAPFHTGYTHQWRDGRFDVFASFLMASADGPQDRADANAAGFRTFRVQAHDDTSKPLAGEFACPASAERGHVTTCDACKACGGHASKARADVVIRSHGPKAKRFVAVA